MSGGIGRFLREGVLVYLRPYWVLCGVLLLLATTLVAVETAIPVTIRFLIDRALVERSQTSLETALMMLFLLTVFAVLARLMTALVRAHLHKEVFWDLNIQLFRCLSRLPISYYDNLQPGHFGPIFDHDIRKVAEMVRDAFSRGFHTLLQFVVIMITMLVMKWQLALIILVLLPLAVVGPQRALRSSLEAYNIFRTVIARINNTVHDFVSTQALTRAFGRNEIGVAQFAEQVAMRGKQRNRLRSVADVRRARGLPHFGVQMFKLSIEFYKDVIMFTTVAFGAWLSFSDQLTLGTLAAFILLLPVAMNALGTLSEYIHDLGQADLSFQRIKSIRTSVMPNADPGDLLELDRIENAVAFKQVEFGYVPGRPTVRDINLTLPIGRTVAFVGRSGAGKTTLIKLLLGLYTPTAGEITIDGHELHSLRPDSVGARIGTVLQTSVMINASIRDNICFAMPEATEEQMIDAAKAAGIHEFVSSLPDGYNAEVGEGGKWLSEGQKQRIALARAILPSPDLLLLDEVTASLDPENEASVNATIGDLASKTTIMIVTHRLSSVTFADHIVVMDQGRIKEQGRHAHLLELNGLYSHFWQLQNGFSVTEDGHHAAVSGTRLKAIPLFKSVTSDVLDQLANHFVSQNFEADQPIYREGEAADKFYILVRGSVSITSRNAGNKIIHLAQLQDGDYFGEMEMINRGRRTTSVTSRTPCLVLTLYADQFDKMAGEINSLGKIVTQMALGRSLSTISSMGRRRRRHTVWKKLSRIV